MSDCMNISAQDVQLVTKFEVMIGYAQECATLYSEMELLVTKIESIQTTFMSASEALDGMYYGQGSERLAEYLIYYKNHASQIAIYLQMCQSFIDICNNTILQEDQRLQEIMTAMATFCVTGGENGG